MMTEGRKNIEKKEVGFLQGKMEKKQKEKIIQIWMNRNDENENILKYKSPSPAPLTLHVHPHLIFLFSTLKYHHEMVKYKIHISIYCQREKKVHKKS
jgi:hypothetical protein